MQSGTLVELLQENNGEISVPAVIYDSNGPLDSKHLEILEKKLGKKLPLDFRAFLLKFNGGYPEPDSFNFFGSEDGSCVDRFLGINVGEHSNLYRYFKTYSKRIPKEFLPIAHDPGGNLICIGLFGEYKNKIYFWDHEFEANGHEPNMTNMHLISGNFSEFLEVLHEVEID